MALRLSIIVPLYNSEAWLRKCLDSLLKQDIPSEEYEIILVNDGSPDGSKALAEDYASKFSNIVILSQENKGTSGARNTGLRYASGKYVYFVDPDDYILENSLKAPLKKMEDESLDVLRFGYTEVDESYQPTKSCKHPEQPDYSSAIMDGYTFMGQRLGIACYVWTFLFKASLLKDNAIYFYEGDYFDDTPWLPRVLAKAKRVDSLDWKRHFYLIRSGSLVQSQSERSIQKRIEGQRFLIREMTRQRNECESECGRVWYGRILTHCAVSLLSTIGNLPYKERGPVIKELKGSGLLPLSPGRASLKKRIKFTLINLSPGLFCWYINHIKGETNEDS